MDRDDPAYAGQSEHTPFFLRIYDPVVFGAGRTANTGGGNDVLISYDGDTAVRHDEVCIVRDRPLHPDGSLWVLGPAGLFVIGTEVAHSAGAAPDGGTNQGG